MKINNKKNKRFTATLEEDKIHQVHEVAEEFKKDGIKIDQVLSLSGIITGKAPNPDVLDKYKSKGIKIETSRLNHI